ncbi:hypothetical protein KQX54_014960 [Cotesia glomerata]|uniref:Uncharacterized protein n=1 Tax=Cotesia glomerata TaxID=32391 RepID=A0AAV7I418_COTGL|nr:hypothetical protein KQX54_014960 [Cotesia glomerata]
MKYLPWAEFRTAVYVQCLCSGQPLEYPLESHTRLEQISLLAAAIVDSMLNARGVNRPVDDNYPVIGTRVRKYVTIPELGCCTCDCDRRDDNRNQHGVFMYLPPETPDECSVNGSRKMQINKKKEEGLEEMGRKEDDAFYWSWAYVYLDS